MCRRFYIGMSTILTERYPPAFSMRKIGEPVADSHINDHAADADVMRELGVLSVRG